MERFMTVDKEIKTAGHFEQNKTSHLLVNGHVPHHIHDRVLNLNDFMKQLTKIMEEFNDKSKFLVASEAIKDFSFSRILFKKCGDLMNLFFDSQ
jgi:hypothetical protein